MTTDLSRRIDQGTGREPADIVLKGGRFFDLVTGELVTSDIAICGETIVGTCGSYTGRQEIDISGLTVVPASSTRISTSNPPSLPRMNSTAASCPTA